MSSAMSTVVVARAGTGSRWRRVIPPALVVGGLAAATVALHLRDPHEQGTWGICPTKALFGIDCPGCGGLRAVNDLTNLQVLDAASSNLLFVASIPLLVTMWVRSLRQRWAGVYRPVPQWVTLTTASVVVTLMVVFTVVRNLPFGSWLAP